MNINSSQIAKLKTKYGTFNIQTFEELNNSSSHNLLWNGDLDLSKKLTLRIQSSCLTSTAFGARICDCADQTELALKNISTTENYILMYLQDEGRGYGMLEKNNIMHFMNNGYDTFSAFDHRGLSADIRDYEIVFDILSFLNIKTTEIDLVTNNPNKLNAFKSRGFKINRIPHIVEIHKDIENYLKSKKNKLGHLIDI